MCGRYTLATPDPSQLRARFAIGERLQLRRRYNVAPGDDVLAVLRPRDDAEPQGALLRWGLVPHWADDPKRSSASRRSTRAPRRSPSAPPTATRSPAGAACSSPTASTSGPAGMPHWITRADGAPFAFAGAVGARGARGAPTRVEPLRTCAIVTTAAAGAVRDLHDRMPVILDPPTRSRGSTPRRRPRRCMPCSRPTAPARCDARPVSRAVNDARHDAPDCLDPPEQASLF